MTINKQGDASKPNIWFNQIMTKEHSFFVDFLLGKLDKGSHPLGILFEAQALSALVGFDFNSVEETLNKLVEETAEVKEAAEAGQDLKLVDELGDVLFSVINVARHLGVHPDTLARATAKKYLARCQFIEQNLEKEGRNWQDLTRDEINIMWKKAKSEGIGEAEFEKELEPFIKDRK